MPYFLCHELAAEYVLQNGELTCVRQAENASHYLR
jgi:diaminopimelate decarboxylase